MQGPFMVPDNLAEMTELYTYQQKVWYELQLLKQGNKGICTSNYRKE